jgi:anti-sigma regulatory factor (Ser/Thr protein kinase)
MELTISAAPFELAGLRRAARDALGEVPTQVADEMLLALDEAATNAILHGSSGGDPIQVAVRVGDAVASQEWCKWFGAQAPGEAMRRP